MDLCCNYLIDSLSCFKDILFYIIDWVNNQKLEQFYKTDRVGYYEKDIRFFEKDDCNPDILICFFHNNINSKDYELSVEFYHGYGGYWKEIESDSQSKTEKSNLLSNIIKKFKK